MDISENNFETSLFFWLVGVKLSLFGFEFFYNNTINLRSFELDFNLVGTDNFNVIAIFGRIVKHFVEWLDV